MKRLCLLTISPFTKRDYERYAIDQIKNFGYEVLILDCTPFLDRPFENYIVGKDVCIKNKNIKRCYSFSQFFKYFSEFNPDWTIDFISYHRKKYLSTLLVRIFIKFKTKIIYYRTGTLPLLENENFYQNKKFVFIRKIKFYLGQIMNLPWQIMGPDMVFLGGYSEYLKYKDKNKIIYAHNLDYDNYLKIINFNNLKNNSLKNNSLKNNSLKNILFLDEDFAGHSDYFREDIRPELNQSEYFSEMSFCLNTLGKRLNLKPIVKLHPRANFEKSTEFYKVDITHKDTAKIVYESDLVVAHCSTSIQLAVLFYKPIILIIPNKLSKNSYFRLIMENFKKELGIKCLRTKDILTIKNIPKVNFRKYDRYKEKFIKMSCSENKFSWEILVNHL